VYYEYGHALLSLAEVMASVFGNSAGAEDDGDVEQEARETADDLQVAWEMLEVARVIYSRFPEELAVEKELARVYMRLGDLGMESEVFEQAKSDYEKSLMLRKKILKITKDPDTTLLADLYCCLAISCIYQDTAKTTDAEAEATSKIHASLSREEQGMKYYVLAGRVMSENIYRVAEACPPQLLDFVEQRLPKYSSSLSEDEDATPSKGKGKRKASAMDSSLALEYKLDNITSLKDDFLTCVQVYKSLAGDTKAEGDSTEAALTKDEAQLLEYLEIYVELKEKVDGIKESASAELVGLGGAGASGKSEQTADGGAVTTIGFGAPAATASAPATAPVNLLPVVKKRKITPETGDEDEGSK
jgi:hypothetical protein